MTKKHLYTIVGSDLPRIINAPLEAESEASWVIRPNKDQFHLFGGRCVDYNLKRIDKYVGTRAKPKKNTDYTTDEKTAIRWLTECYRCKAKELQDRSLEYLMIADALDEGNLAQLKKMRIKLP